MVFYTKMAGEFVGFTDKNGAYLKNGDKVKIYDSRGRMHKGTICKVDPRIIVKSVITESGGIQYKFQPYSGYGTWINGQEYASRLIKIRER
jgi:hypothetical protein